MSYLDDMNFNLDENVSETALVNPGEYFGSIIETTLNDESNFIKFKISLNNNEGMCMSNGETPVDGVHLDYLIWLPKPGDEEEMIKSGRETKANWKLKNLKKALTAIQAPQKAWLDIKEAILNGEWNGLDIKVLTSINEYNGEVREQVDKMWVPAEI